jgi:hypothetical protein
VCVVALLVAYAAMAYTASLAKGCSFDEAQQLAVGYNVWLNADYRIEGANGDFIKRWATLPYLISRPDFVDRDDPAWKRGDAYELGRRFFFDVGNQPERLLRQGRAMVVVLGVVAAPRGNVCGAAAGGGGGWGGGGGVGWCLRGRALCSARRADWFPWGCSRLVRTCWRWARSSPPTWR